MRGIFLTTHYCARRRRIGIRYFIVATLLMTATAIYHHPTQAISCPELRVVFARGSGSERWVDQNYLEYKNTIESKLAGTGIEYEFIDLNYPAIGVGIDNLGVTLGAFVGAGDAYEFGASVNQGAKNLTALVNSGSCPNTKYVAGGYSQGAMVISKALKNLNANKLIYAVTFGDPKIYLPEGKGVIPTACRGDNLSDYRMYVPDCQAYKGLLGAYIPYEPDNLVGKVGTWCNKRDIFCSSHLSIKDHVAYISDNLYEDASRVVFDKIAKTFGIKNHISSPHDTAILIDSTGSMREMINKYKAEALRLARETLESGGRVALYDYRDLGDPYTPKKHCGFEDCTLEIFSSALDNIVTDSGGDWSESLLSATFHTMTDLKWKYGATKSLVVLTDADFLSPDRDGMSFDEVVAMSKKIDPVNFYIITDPNYGDYYTELARVTDGKVVTDFDQLSLLTDQIMERYDSLPRVEEDLAPVALPTLEIKDVEREAPGKAKIKFTTSGDKAVVVLNGAILGISEGDVITVEGLDDGVENMLSLVPLGDDVRGEAAEISLNSARPDSVMTIPKAPNTGKGKVQL